MPIFLLLTIFLYLLVGFVAISRSGNEKNLIYISVFIYLSPYNDIAGMPLIYGLSIPLILEFLLLIYVIIVYRIVAIGNSAKNNFARLYCFGFATAFFIYVAVNMSMVLGLLPIVGAPLPIMSYGGSSMLSMMIGLGIVMSCKIYQQEGIN